MNKVERINELVQELNKYAYDYYTLDNPTISDAQYDALFDELMRLELETGHIMSNSPTQKVGSETLSKLEKVEHKIPLKSLDKTKSVQDIIKFAKGRELIAMLKADGLTCEIDFQNGNLIEASTRGNSIIGEKITHNARTFKNIPLSIKDGITISVSGESVIFIDDFDAINNTLNEDEKYKTPRNLVAGSVRQLSNEVCAKRNVNFLAFNVLSVEGFEIKTKYEQLQFLRNLGFCIIPNMKVSEDELKEEKLLFIIDCLKATAKEYSIPIDGIVFTFNDLEYAKSLGETSHHPLGSLSYKFFDEIENTVLRNVEWQVSKYGMLTPVSCFDTVIIDGTEVSKASLHNLNFIEEKKLNIGCNIGIVKRNQIIPHVEVNYDTDKGILAYPSECPCCGAKTEIRQMQEGRFLYCTNRDCKDRLVQLLKHFASRDALNITGVSEAILETFVDKGFIKSFADIFRLEKYKKEIISLDGFGLKSYNNMMKSIETVKTETKLENFLFALSIPNVGKSTAKDLVKFANSDEALLFIMYAPVETLLKMPDCGEVTANSIVDYFNNENNIKVINELLQYITLIEDKKKEVVNTDNSLNGKHVYPTGVFNLKKNELKQKLESVGAIVENGYKKSLDYLICGGDTSKSGKVDKAKTDGVPLMTEDEMMNILGL